MNVTYLKEIKVIPAARSYAEFVCNQVELVDALESLDVPEMAEEAKENGWSGWEAWSDLTRDQILAAIAAHYCLWEAEAYDLKTGEGLQLEITGEQIIEYLDHLSNSVSPETGAAPGEIFGIEDVTVYLD